MIALTNAVSHFLQMAYLSALPGQAGLHEKWAAWSHKMAAAYGLDIVCSCQEDGRIDIILRELEREVAARLPSQGLEMIWADNLHSTLANYWAVSTYDTISFAVRSTRRPSHPRLLAVHRKLELVRVPLSKLRIAQDKKLRAPVMLGRLGGPEKPPEPYSFDKPVDYVPPGGWDPATGSRVWIPINSKSKQMTTISRRTISDECLALFDD